MPFSPLGKGFLTGKIDDTTSLDSTDFRDVVPRFTAEPPGEPGARRPRGRGRGAEGRTQAQVALAWVLAQKPWMVPIPGTTKRTRLEENIGAAEVELTADDLAEIDAAASRIEVVGARYSEAARRMIDR